VTALDDLVAAARRGDARAFNGLVDHHQPVAYHVAVLHLGNADDALDACQEAMLSAWRAISSFRGDGAAFRAWLLAIVANTCHDRQRYAARRPTVPLDPDATGDGLPLPLPDPGQSPEDYAASADLAALLAAALARLSDEHRMIVLLDHVGLSYAEIAVALGVEVGTVKSRLSRARARLRDILTGADDVGGGVEPLDSPRRSIFAPAAPRGPRAELP
jgi:RNA polymerase sigma-70 factor, ECF subfamily